MSGVTPEFNEVWRYEGHGNNETDGATGGAVDSDGNLILAGVQGFDSVPLDDDTFINTLSSEFAAVKLLGESGAIVWYWTDRSIGDGSQLDGLFGADTDSNNDVILAGYTTGFWTMSNPHGVRHIAVVKLDGSTGEEIWRFQDVSQDSYTSFGSYVYYGSGNAFEVAVDHEDNVFLVGGIYNSLVYGEGDPGDRDYFMMKISGSTGAELFTVQGGLSYHWDSLRGVKVDSTGDVVAAGTSGLEDQTDFLVVKISGTDGDLLWEYSPYSSTIDVFHAIDLDDLDDVYVAGGEDADNRQGIIAESPVVTKLSGTDGSLIWTYSGMVTSPTVFRSIAVDPTTGWVVGAGYREVTSWLTTASYYETVAAVLDGDTGDELTRYENGTYDAYFIRYVGFDSTGALFFGGSTYGGSESVDFLGVKFSPLAIASTPAPSKSPTTVPVFPTPVPLALTPAPMDLTPAPVTLTSPPTSRIPAPIAPSPASVVPSPSLIALTPTPVAPTPIPVDPTPAPVTLTSLPTSRTPAPIAPSPASVVPSPSLIALTPAPVAPTPIPVDPTFSPISQTPISIAPSSFPVIFSPAPVVPIPASMTSTPEPTLQMPNPMAPTRLPVAPTASGILTSMPMSVDSPAAPMAPTPVPAITFPLPTPAPTTAISGGASVLAMWEIGVISMGSSAFLLLFALCLCFLRRRRTQDEIIPGISGCVESIPPSNYGQIHPQMDALPWRRLPTYKSAVLEVNGDSHDPPPPAQEVLSPPPPINEPPSFQSPPPPLPLPPPPRPLLPPVQLPTKASVSGSSARSQEPPPPFREITPRDEQSPAQESEKPWQRLAKRIRRVSSKNLQPQHSYRDIPVRIFGPYVPAPGNR